MIDGFFITQNSRLYTNSLFVFSLSVGTAFETHAFHQVGGVRRIANVATGEKINQDLLPYSQDPKY